MSHLPFASTAAPAGPSACHDAAPSLTAKPRGNPDLHLALRCGARTRAGCPCRAPAIHGKLRCRMHGGRSTGPRTPEGMARLRAARTVHGAYGAETRARNRHSLTELRRGQVGDAAVRCLDRLPSDLAARLMQMPPELLPQPWPTGGLTPAQDRAVLRAEADALAPWRAAIARAGRPGWAGRARQAVVVDRPGAPAEAHAPVHAPMPRHGVAAAARDTAGSAHPNGAAKPHAPELSAGAGGTALAASPVAPAATCAKAHAPERAAAAPASAALVVASQSKPHAPERSKDSRGVVVAATLAAHGGPMLQPAEAHAPESGAEDCTRDRGGCIRAAAPATFSASMQQPAEAHAPEHRAPEHRAPERRAPERRAPERPVASDAVQGALPNRAARRRLKSLQRRQQPASAGRSSR